MNKLAEYIVSKGARQRTILHQRKYPDPDFNAGTFYREAGEAIGRYLADGAVDSSILDKQAAILKQKPADNIGTSRRLNANIDAIERFSNMLDDVDLCGAEPALGSNYAEKMTFGNVAISVRPELILRGTGAKGRKFVGGIKLHFSTQYAHGPESAGYVSAVVQEFCRLHIAQDEELVSPEYCAVYDVGSGTIFQGVKATKARLKDIQAECLNIAGIWSTL
ncbi:hypothetical protein [Aureimonas psammosilenae]|uniref:hypothetical protein n=1 Tax=Aureimonas psammosilenae TaxID=2495496 RepID=UPI00126068CB|nr:hypothetical protein [Aureimonas psammosilenae]